MRSFKPLFTIGNLPSSYLLSMTYEEQIIWLCNYLKETVIPELEELERKIDIVDADKIQQQLDDMKAYILRMEVEINSEFNDLETNLTNKINSEIKDNYDEIIGYLNYELDKINQKIDNISIDSIMMRNPVTGNIDNIQKVIDDIYYGSTNGITVDGFDAKQLTASGFDALNLTAYDFDTNSGNLL